MEKKKVVETIPKVNGKSVLLDSEGKRVYFSHPVDAREALTMNDEDGKPRYRIPEISVPKFQGEKVEDVFNSESVTEKREVKEISKEDILDKIKADSPISKSAKERAEALKEIAGEEDERKEDPEEEISEEIKRSTRRARKRG